MTKPMDTPMRKAVGTPPGAGAASATAIPDSPMGRVLKGRYLGPVRSPKGKLKGLMLQSPQQVYGIQLPKYLRPLLVRELLPGQLIQVWAYAEADRWRAINLMPLPAAEAAAMVVALPAAALTSPPAAARPTAAMCIEVCSKGKCCKQGSRAILQQLQQAVETTPELAHVSIRATGCLKACKQGPNLRVQPSGQLLSRVTPERALTLLADGR